MNQKIIVFLSALILVCRVPAFAEQSLSNLDGSAQAIIKSRLKDPESLVIRNTHLVNSNAPDGRGVVLLCGEYNARNSFGGMVGFKPFVYEAGVMRGVASMEADHTFDFFSADGSGDLSHDRRQPLAAGEAYAQWKVKHDRAIAFVVRYMPACLGLK